MNRFKFVFMSMVLGTAIAFASMSFGLVTSSLSSEAYAQEDSVIYAMDESGNPAIEGVVIENATPQKEVVVEPALEVTKELLAWVKTIPKVGPVIQTILEILSIGATALGLLYGFIYGLFRLPGIAATKWGSPETAAKFDKLWAKVKPILDFIGKILGPNVPKK